jgi:twitching motility protein PilJ
MSVVDQVKNLFTSKSSESAIESRLSLSMPDDSSQAADGETVQNPQEDTDAPMNATRSAPVDDAFAATRNAEKISIPILGTRTVGQHQRILYALGTTALVVLLVTTVYVLSRTNKVAQQLGATGQALMQSQRLAKSVSQALVGSVKAFPAVSESADVLVKTARGLRSGDAALKLKPLDDSYDGTFTKLNPLIDRAETSAKAVMAQEKVLTQIGAALRLISRQSSDLQDLSESILALKIKNGASNVEVSAVGQLIMLTQRLVKSANEFLTPEGVSPEAVFLLGKDVNTFKEVTDGLLSGNAELRLTAAKDADTREQLEALSKLFDETRVQTSAILGNMQGLVAAREAQDAIISDSEALRLSLEELQTELSSHAGITAVALFLLIAAVAVAGASAFGISRVQLQDSRKRRDVAENQRLDAERQEQEAKRVNDANQAAILRLMNELQTVAEGDLTQEATVTEDITGAIADSVNYTVEELRSLVANVQSTVARVAQTTADVDATSTELLAASNEQLHEIRETGKSVVDMAGRINEVSTQAQESATVARQSLQAAESGLKAVQDAIGGMNSIRDQIQETSKRIKRLGESSQEIGEITELISDITEQTNVLALNAAIQAASAGEAGRGFSVVAEEVQRLAERSADATRQISALVKAIQTDTQDAIGAMERSTQGVVEGARLSDNAGTALTEIDRVSRQVADLIEQISSSASREAGLANVVADNIQHIFAVTEQTGEGTRVTATQVRELSRMAEELRLSVSRFKIA